MPVYLCQSGSGCSEPWRHGIQVYASPFMIEDNVDSSHNNANNEGGGGGAGTSTIATLGGGGGRDLVIATFASPNPPAAVAAGSTAPATSSSTSHQNRPPPPPIRRVRHAEIVLVDDVCIAYDRYWLRLRWPGRKGGFAGYMAMSKVFHMSSSDRHSLGLAAGSSALIQVDMTPHSFGRRGDDDEPGGIRRSSRGGTGGGVLSSPAVEEADDDARETSSMPPSEPMMELFSSDSNHGDTAPLMTCLRTGMPFPSSQALKLLALYDDGVTPAVALSPCGMTEPVFCRICREGLHDDADDEQPAAADDDREDAAATAPGGGGGRGRVARDPLSARSSSVQDPDDDDDNNELLSSEPPPPDTTLGRGGGGSLTASSSSHGIALGSNYKGPIQPHPAYAPNAEALQNPLLAPCECSGSMAFVHYLCVEQWRCRSRHPEAQLGKNCETCGKPYSLPPPLERPASHPNNNQMDQEDWLEAMPPHVMQALRQPHLCWQIGAALVRRRWLRPLAPIFTSPIVALYCRARRLLKKRGVARRRWACSLCRRRARWKCVRCLRSYYCSRQCQNVSWHIVHKHVCYKPSRFCQSIVAYGALTLALFPGILRDPFMYDLGLCLIPASFVVTGILGGGVGLVAKKWLGVDIRGRFLELAVVVLTIVLSLTSWGLVKGFFGMPEQCHGLFYFSPPSSGTASITEKMDIRDAPRLLRLVSAVLLKPAEWVYSQIDVLLQRSTIVGRVVCHSSSRSNSSMIDVGAVSGGAGVGCFEHLPCGDFCLEPAGRACASDLMLVTCLYLLAYVVYVGSAAWKHQDRLRRQRGVGAGGGRGGGAAAAQQQQQHRFAQQQQQQQARPHQD